MNMRELQKQALESKAKELGASLTWSDDLTGVRECACYSLQKLTR